MDAILWAIDLIYYIVSTMLVSILNVKLWEYGSGENYLVLRVYHFFYTGVGTTFVLFVLRLYFKRGK